MPGGPYLVPMLGAASPRACSCTRATTHTIIRLFAWLALGMVFYYFYGRKHSKLRLAHQTGQPIDPPPTHLRD